MSYTNGPKIVTNELFLYLNASNSKSYPGSGNFWNDLSGNNNHGTLINGPINNGLSFNFVGASSQRVSIPYKSEWRMIGSNTVFYISKEDSHLGCVVAYKKSSWQGYNFLGNSVSYSSIAGGNDLGYTVSKSNGEWSMNTIVIDRSAGFYYVYKNNVLVHTKAIIHPDLSGVFSDGELTVGGNNTITSRYYTGSISVVGFYKKALSTLEVVQNYNALKGRFQI
jgi:hypothetical protein